MTHEEFDQREKEADDMEHQGWDLIKKSKELAEETLRLTGIKCHDREPGFPCWTHDSLNRYYNSPRETLTALIIIGFRSENLKGGGLKSSHP